MIDSIFVRGYTIRDIKTQDNPCLSKFDINGVYTEEGDIDFPSDHKWILVSLVETCFIN
jgi:hypothetical protein